MKERRGADGGKDLSGELYTFLSELSCNCYRKRVFVVAKRQILLITFVYMSFRLIIANIHTSFPSTL